MVGQIGASLFSFTKRSYINSPRGGSGISIIFFRFLSVAIAHLNTKPFCVLCFLRKIIWLHNLHSKEELRITPRVWVDLLVEYWSWIKCFHLGEYLSEACPSYGMLSGRATPKVMHKRLVLSLTHLPPQEQPLLPQADGRHFFVFWQRPLTTALRFLG